MTASTEPRSYSLVLPPGWQRLSLGPQAEAEVRALLDVAFTGVPRDRAAPFRRELEKILLAQVAKARAEHGLDLYLPVRGTRGRPVPASFVVAHVVPDQLSADSAADVATVELLAALLDGRAADGGRLDVEVAGAPAVRIEDVQAPSLRPPFEVERPSRRVHYVVPVPGGGAGLLMVSFSTALTEAPTGSDGRVEPRLSDALVDLFDAVMTTLRWRHA